jgi:hypothetical protein
MSADTALTGIRKRQGRDQRDRIPSHNYLPPDVWAAFLLPYAEGRGSKIDENSAFTT